jgi:hypothetical protein
MSLFPEYDANKREIFHKKTILKIGLFGSFHAPRKRYIDSLKSYLIDKSYLHTFDASDFPEVEYKSKDDKYAKALENSEQLLKNSDVRIFFIFLENDGEHGINESVIIEIGFLFKMAHESGVILIIEDGAEKQMHANMKGILVKGRSKFWTSIPFDPQTYTHEEMVELSCYNYIGKMLHNR